MEKKRRDRINKCLEELKDLMVQSNDKARYQKLEKAEILEMAVGYVKSLKQTASNSFINEIIDFNSDNLNKQNVSLLFEQLLNDFENYIQTCSDVKDEQKFKFINYMNQRYEELILFKINDSFDLTAKKPNSEVKRSSRASPYQLKPQNNLYTTSITQRKEEKKTFESSKTFTNNLNYLNEENLNNNSKTTPSFLNSQNSYEQFISFYQTDRSMDSKVFEISLLHESICFESSNKDKVWRPW